MKSSNKRFAQKSIAVVVIVTLLYGAGVTPIAMLFVSGVICLVFMISRRSQNREVERVFDFYLAADAILRDEERRWYGFEVAEVIESGEDALETLPDPPPLYLFTLGALHNLLGNYNATQAYLSRFVDNEYSEERYHKLPSPQLRRYVTLLRRIEAEPSLAPQTLGAVRSLERMRRRLAPTILAESRKALAGETVSVPQLQQRPNCLLESSAGNGNASPRPSIQELLNDIYQDEGPAN
jgi:hypothetical protein